MPLPRFAKLGKDKQELILSAAAEEFTQHGYEHATMARILSKAGISKGAAYYYFNGKADLFNAVTDRYMKRLDAVAIKDYDTLTAETFWPSLAEESESIAKLHTDNPWMNAVLKMLCKLPWTTSETEEISEGYQSYVKWVESLVKRGQEVGVIRRDLPKDFLIRVMLAVDNVQDEWMVEHWDRLTQPEIEAIMSRLITDLWRRLLEPKEKDHVR